MPTHASKAAIAADRAPSPQHQPRDLAMRATAAGRPWPSQRTQDRVNQSSPRVQQAAAPQARIAESPRQQQAAQREVATPVPGQRKANQTGLPDHLKAGVEHLSGHSLDDVRVHYNSAKPTQLRAHAYVQGTDSHLGPGQEKPCRTRRSRNKAACGRRGS